MQRKPFHDMWLALKWGAIGAAAAYLLDPERGKERRAQLAEQVKARAMTSMKEGQEQLGLLKDKAQETLSEVAESASDKIEKATSNGRSDVKATR